MNFTFLTEHLWTTASEFRRRTQIPEFYHYLKKQRFPFATICVESLHFWKQQAFSPVVHLQQAFRKAPSQIFSVKMLAWGWRAEKYFLLFICFSMKLFPVALVSFSDLGSLHFPFRPSFLLLSYDLKNSLNVKVHFKEVLRKHFLKMQKQLFADVLQNRSS